MTLKASTQNKIWQVKEGVFSTVERDLSDLESLSKEQAESMAEAILS
ncbi:hypothetical protein [Moritella viscosa]|uniref:Uncharacterized protein n=1 Tax=Moritella viscosa TaxID=80854 RepID=A0ABY1HJA1_9GAMM|nr:hypothetical protein [Moritella viscosa]SGZ00578.1 unnamed protein product [Moritella viscosa]